jgi:hypothetical protein
MLEAAWPDEHDAFDFIVKLSKLPPVKMHVEQRYEVE